MDLYFYGIALFWLIMPTAAAVLLAWPLVRQRKRGLGFFLGAAILGGFLLIGWQYSLYNIQTCVRSCLSAGNTTMGSCQESCRQAVQPAIDGMLVLTFFNLLIFALIVAVMASKPRKPWEIERQD